MLNAKPIKNSRRLWQEKKYSLRFTSRNGSCFWILLEKKKSYNVTQLNILKEKRKAKINEYSKKGGTILSQPKAVIVILVFFFFIFDWKNISSKVNTTKRKNNFHINYSVRINLEIWCNKKKKKSIKNTNYNLQAMAHRAMR